MKKRWKTLNNWSFSNRQTNECLHSTPTFGENRISNLVKYDDQNYLWDKLFILEPFLFLILTSVLMIFKKLQLNWPNFPSPESCQKSTKSSRAHQVSLVADEESFSVIDWAISHFTNFKTYSEEKLIECISTL